MSSSPRPRPSDQIFLYVGQRFSFASATCTVRYIGEVHGTQGEWLGVEWDDPTRGKHSGEHDGVKYFKCKSQHPTAGSFIRYNRPHDPPYGFLNALRQKYASDVSFPEIENDGLKERPKQVDHPIEWGGKLVEEVGFEKIRQRQAQLKELRIVLLDGCCVAGLCSEGLGVYYEKRQKCMKEIRDVCPNIVELDLSRNLLERWQEVVDICAQLKKLQSLRVNGNRFFIFDPGHEKDYDLSASFGGIKELGLDETLLSWEKIVDLTSPFTSLSSLSASFNQFSIIDRPLKLQNITKITLEHNNFTSLSDIAPLSMLPLLASLDLGHNQISGINSTNGTQHETQVPRFSETLSYVDLSYNAIRDWRFLDELQDVFPGLTGLRLAHNPLYDVESRHGAMDVEESFMLTLARLPRLTSLNFSNIERQERTNAELYYLSRIVREIEDAPESQQADIIRRHPRYDALCQLYGPPTITRKSADAIDPNSLEARLINFTFVYILDKASGPIIKSKKIPRSFDIYRVKGVVGRLFGIKKPMKTRLVWETGEWDPLGGDDESDDSNWDLNGETERNGNVNAAPKEKWIRREVELEDGTREVGFWIDGREARVRVEPR